MNETSKSRQIWGELERAVLTGSGIDIGCGPDPVRPEAGALVFSIPGWDILDRARAAGFSQAEMVYDSSASRGCVAGDMSGVMHFRAQA